MLRDLWRHRYAVLGVLLVAVLASTLLLYKFSPPLQLESRNYNVGVATSSVLIDTPSSQVARIAPEGSENLGMRADLLARLMVDGAIKAEIAKAAGLDPDALVGISTTASDQPVSAAPPPGASVLTTNVVLDNAGTQLPIIRIEAQAVDAASAAKLADAAVTGLQGYVDAQAANTKVPDNRRVRVSRNAPTQAETAVRGPKSIFALALGIFVFALGCAVILGGAALVRTWHTTTAAERPWSDDEIVWLEDMRHGARERESSEAGTASPPRPVEPIRPVPAPQPSPLRPADDARSTQDDHPHGASSQSKPRRRDRRRQSAS